MLTLFFTYLSLLLPLRAYAEFQIHNVVPLAPSPGMYQLKGEFDYLSSAANFPAGGGPSTALPAGGSYSNMLGVGQVAYDWDRNWRTYAGMSGGQARANVIDVTNALIAVDTVTVTTSGLSEFWAGAQFWWRARNFDVVPEIDFTYPAFRVDPNGNNPLLGEGAMVVKTGGWLMYRYAGFTPFAYGAYLYRDEARSGLFSYRTGLRYRERKMWWAELEWRGVETLLADGNTAYRSTREGYLTHVDGGSFEYYSINPRHGEFAGRVGLPLGSFGLYLGGSLAAFGRSSADDWSVTAGITLNERWPSFDVGGPTYSHDETYFNSRPEKYDENLFKEKAVPEAAPNQEAGEEAPEIAVKPKVVKKRKRPPQKSSNPGPMPRVQLMMKETQKQLEKNDR